MPADFPTSLVLRCPVERTLRVPTRVIAFLDGSEQRFATGDPLNAFSISFPDAVASEISTIANWFDTIKGAFDSTWGFTSTDGVAYPSMGLEQDDLTAVEGSRVGRWAVALKMRQVAPAGSYAAAAPATYPALANGCYTQRPFTRGRKWRTTRNDVESGPRYAWAELAAALRSWTCEYPVLTLSEVQTRIAFAIAARGRYRTFTFHDPELGINVANCRLDADEIVVRCLGAGQWSTKLGVEEFVA